MEKKKFIINSFTALAVLIISILSYTYFMMLPHQLESKLFFLWKQKHFDALVDELKKHHDIRAISLIENKVLVEEYSSDFKRELTGHLAEKFKQLIKNSKLPMHWKVENGTLLYIQSAEKFDRDFNLAFVKRDAKSGKPLCGLALVKEEYGSCEIRLKDQWVLDYTWYPLNYNLSEE